LSSCHWTQSGRARLKPAARVHKQLATAVLCFGATLVAWSPVSFAQRQAITAGTTPLSPTGGLNGVDMSGAATLSVGSFPGPEMDIFTTNTSLTSPLPAVSTTAASFGNIVFNSSSTVYGSIGTTGHFLLNIFGGNAGTAVNFLGPVFATTTMVTGTGSLNFESGTSNSTATIFNGDGTISLAPNTTVIGALTTTAGTNTGTLMLGGGSVLNGAVGAANTSLKAIDVVGGSNTAGVTATITGAVNAYSFSLGTNTLLIGGALTIADSAPSGVVSTTLASPTLYGNIRPVGATTLGASLHVDVTVPATAYIPVGTQFNIIQAQAGTAQSGSQNRTVLITVENPTNPLYTFSEVPLTGTQAGLVAIKTDSIPLQVPIAPPAGAVLPPGLSIAAPVAVTLLNAPVTPDLVTVLAAINSLSDPAAVVNALAQLAPSTADLAAPLVTFQGTRAFEDLWMFRLDNVMCGQINQPDTNRDTNPNAEPSSCNGNDPRGGWWMKDFGYFGSQGAQGAYGGYDSRILGTMIGYDTPIEAWALGGETHAGLGLGYARSTINGTATGSNTVSDTYQITAYLGHEQGPWFVDGDLSFGWSDYSGQRPIVFPGIDRTAQASYNGQDYTAFLATGFHLFAQGFSITPLASLQYTHLDLGSYGESGAGSIDLNVNAQHYDFLESGLGATVARPFQGSGGTYVPEVHFKWLHELSNPAFQNVAAFAVPGSPTFTTPGLRTSADTLDAGIGLTFLSCGCTAKTWSLEAVYDYFWQPDNYSANQAMIKLTVHF
jgi:uncharacterized protein with beta-barrel porin domain